MDKVWCVSWGADYEGISGWKLFKNLTDALFFVGELQEECGGDWKQTGDPSSDEYSWDGHGDHIYVDQREIN
jgi:hypothetical protein